MGDSMVSSPGKSRRRQLDIEEIFSSVSRCKAHGHNPLPKRVVLTPRSESCLRCGVDHEDLRIRDLDSFWEPDIDPKIQRMRHEAYSQQRHDLMKELRGERAKVTKQHEHRARRAGHAPAAKGSAVGKSLRKDAHKNAALLELENRRLAKIQRRQQREIEQMLQYEMQMTEIIEENARRFCGGRPLINVVDKAHGY